jgi:GNAT superfamily N-acetyltransferase
MTARYPVRWQNPFKQLRWRGPLRFSLLVLRELLSPVMYWYVFTVWERDVELPSDENGEFEVKVYAGRGDLDRLKREIVPMGEISADVIESRLGSGNVVAVAYQDGRAAGYAWMALAGRLEIAFDTAWVLGTKEGAYHGSFTHPNWRGRGIQRYLDAGLMRYAHEHGIGKVFATVSVMNTPSLRARDKIRQRTIMTLVLVRVRGLNWVYRKAFGAPFESRFAISRQGGKLRGLGIE